MLDHIFLTVADVERSIVLYTATLGSLGITQRLDYAGKDGPPGHPDLKGFGKNGRLIFWLRKGETAPGSMHIGFAAESEAMVDAAHGAALAAGALEIHRPGPQLHYDPRYYAAQVADPDGHTIEFVYKSWQHGN